MRRLLRKIDTYHPRQEALALFHFRLAGIFFRLRMLQFWTTLEYLV